ncbi:FkbM family methyltransferase [Streptomyces shenzhenensis]|uniref:FkbM family methyltransferase n=1 Tax=Streptomyces shenzhenensis TaxID=943815 RepID=UPI0015F0BE8E|nr:FkbM family methyltransferase [Streptomyces shenzhenensis]
MTLLHRARLAAQRLGIDVTRFPECTPSHRLVRLLRLFDIDVVLDVGANGGQYASKLRRFGYRGRIVSFEPLHRPLEELRRKADADPSWTVFPYALGAESATITVNVAGNEGMSSSVLPMLDRCTDACPQARYVGRQEAEQRRLDEVWPLAVRPYERVFLKLDVQGYEGAVLRGAGERIEKCSGLQMEVSCVPLYENGLLADEALTLAQRQYGMTLMAVVPEFTDPETGQMLQFDAVFFREGEREGNGQRRQEVIPASRPSRPAADAHGTRRGSGR